METLSTSLGHTSEAPSAWPGGLARTDGEADVQVQLGGDDQSSSLQTTLQTTEPPEPLHKLDKTSTGEASSQSLSGTHATSRAPIALPENSVGSPHTANASNLPSICPPIVYPLVDSIRSSRVHELTDAKDTMEIDGPALNNHDKEDGMEKDRDEQAPCRVSEWNNLKIDLDNALQGDFNFKGNYAFANIFPQAPSPGLHIEGLGVIGLPLNPRDAELIVTVATKAPIGERMIADTTNQDTFEVDLRKVTFANPRWPKFMKDVMTKTVWPELGGGLYKRPPKCQLYKLLLCKTGSRFLPHQVSEKSEAMFATLIILLPSLHAGGQIHVTYGSVSKTFDPDSSSHFNASVLTMYNDVLREIKPITSGYRLALMYDLIHTSSSIPRPFLPDMHSAVCQLRHVLEKWMNGASKDSAGNWENDIVAYILQHEYGGVNLQMGTLKGQDRHMVSHVKGVADELGFKVCLGRLKYVETGIAEDYGMGKSGLRAYDSDSEYDESDSDRGIPGMEEVEEKTLNITSLVDSNGVEMLDGHDLPLNEQSLIPATAFVGATRDEAKYDSGILKYFYRRTVLVLFPKDRQLEILLNAGGVPYAVGLLQKANTIDPTETDRRTAQYVVNSLKVGDKSVAQTMADLAVQWNDVGLWKQVVTASGGEKNVDVLGMDKFNQAWKKFSFSAVRSTFETTLSHCDTLKARLEFINHLPPQASDHERDAILTWCTEQTSFSFTMLKTPPKEDVSTFISVVRSKGISFFTNVILPQLIKFTSTYEFWMEFIPSFFNLKKDLLTPDATSSTVNSAFEVPLDHCLKAAMRQWDLVVAQPRDPFGYHYSGSYTQQLSPKIERILRLIELCISTRKLQACEWLFALILKSPGDLLTKFKTLYNPLISELHRRLPSLRVDLHIPPFSDFFRRIIGIYLQHVLGPKPSRFKPPSNVRKIGCGCSDCRALDAFLASGRSEETFRHNQNRRTHLIERLRSATDLAKFATCRSRIPHGLIVTKTPEMVPAEHWKLLQKDAEVLMRSIGSDAVVERIMGAQYAEVSEALTGTRQFIMSTVDAACYQPDVSMINTSTSSSSASTLMSNSPLIATPAAAQPKPGSMLEVFAAARKRKRMSGAGNFQ